MSTAVILGLSTKAATATLFTTLNTLRNQLSQAKGALATYAPDTSSALRGRMYALEGYTELLLADLYCGDIPLSTLDFEKDFTYRPGSTTAEVYQHARAQFDTAIALSDDSVSIQNLARVGKGRALLAMDSVAQAATAVADVPDGFAYHFIVQWNSTSIPLKLTRAMEADTEGTNGLPFISSGDPRTRGSMSGSIRYPAKYSLTGNDTLIVADWIEAHLIRAEADLDAGGSEWLSMLNTMRTDGTFTTTPDPTNATLIDTTWGFGTARVERQSAGVRPLDDPGTMTARVDSLFSDRAFWLFATGHRLGDLRRFMREPYNRGGDQVYPAGGSGRTYPGAYHYGSDVSAPIPETERANPYFNPAGCVTNVS
jgi:hypothetical protein